MFGLKKKPVDPLFLIHMHEDPRPAVHRKVDEIILKRALDRMGESLGYGSARRLRFETDRNGNRKARLMNSAAKMIPRDK